MIMDGFLVYVNVNEDGEITEGLTGVNIIPDRQYDFFFYLEEKIDLLKYKIEDRQLVKVVEDMPLLPNLKNYVSNKGDNINKITTGTLIANDNNDERVLLLSDDINEYKDS